MTGPVPRETVRVRARLTRRGRLFLRLGRYRLTRPLARLWMRLL